jgi:predicted CopG family antitoxin
MAQIRVTDDQAEELHEKKERGESYADVLERVYGVGSDEN